MNYISRHLFFLIAFFQLSQLHATESCVSNLNDLGISTRWIEMQTTRTVVLVTIHPDCKPLRINLTQSDDDIILTITKNNVNWMRGPVRVCHNGNNYRLTFTEDPVVHHIDGMRGENQESGDSLELSVNNGGSGMSFRGINFLDATNQQNVTRATQVQCD